MFFERLGLEQALNVLLSASRLIQKQQLTCVILLKFHDWRPLNTDDIPDTSDIDC